MKKMHLSITYLLLPRMGTTEDGLKTLYIIASYRQFLQKNGHGKKEGKGKKGKGKMEKRCFCNGIKVTKEDISIHIKY